MPRSRAKEIEALHQELVQRKAKIEAHLRDFADGKEALQVYNETNDVNSKNDESAGGVTEIFTDTEIVASLEKTLKDINQALSVMEKGNYGVCKYCKEEISLGRLKVRPVSTSCVDCKSQFTN